MNPSINPESGPPPGPRFPRIVQSLLMMYWPLGYLRYCRKRFGRIFRAVGFGHPPIVVIADPEGVRGVFRAPREVISAFPGNEIFLRTLGEHSFIFKEGKDHLRERKSAQRFVSAAGQSELIPMISRVANDYLAKWPEGSPFKLLHALQNIAYRTAVRRFVGFGNRTDEDRLCKSVEERRNRSQVGGPVALLFYRFGAACSPWVQRSLSWLSPNARRAAQIGGYIESQCREELHRKLAGGIRSPDLCGSYLDSAVQDFQESGEEEMDERVLLDNLNLLLVTGHESAAVTTSWLISELLRHPEILEHIQKEVDSMPEVVSDASDIPPTPLLDMAILETFRLHPPIPVTTRSSLQTFTVGGYTVPKGTTILPCMFLAHHDPELWEDPEAFRPDRFADGKAYPNLFFPFGGGSHRCPGSDMGIFQVKFITSAILKRFTVSYRGTRPPRSKYVVATVIPDNKMPVSVQTRPATSRESGSSDRSESISCPMHTETDQPLTCPHESQALHRSPGDALDE